MKYYISKNVENKTYAEVVDLVKSELKKEGFGVLTEINVQSTLKAKIDKDIEPYTILGACNPPFAYKAITEEPLIGVFLPCNVVVRELAENVVEVAAVDPVASMMAVENASLGEVATEIQQKLKKVVDSL